jgi:hypothetical protein
MTSEDACEHLKDYLSGIIAQREVALLHFEDIDALYAKAAAFDRIAAIIAEKGTYERVVEVVQGVTSTA